MIVRSRLQLLALLWVAGGCAGKGAIPPRVRAPLPFPGPVTTAPLAGAEVTPILRDKAAMTLSQVLELAREKPNEIRLAKEDLAEKQAQVGHYAAESMLPRLTFGEEFQYHVGSMQVQLTSYFGRTGRRHFLHLRAMLHDVDTIKIYSELSAKGLERDAADEHLGMRRVGSTSNGAELYFGLQQRQALVVVAREALARAKEYLVVAASREKEKVGLTVDRLWAESEVAKRDEAVVAAEEKFRVGSSELATFLRLDPTVLLHSPDAVVQPVTFFTPETSVDELIRVAHENRPDVRQLGEMVDAEEHRLFGSKLAPFIPHLTAGLLGFEGGLGFEGSELTSLAPRGDVLAVAFWEVRGLGLADYYTVQSNKARLGIAEIKKDVLMEEASHGVIAAHQAIRSRFLAIEAAKRELAAADEAWNLSIKRVEQGLGIAAEVLAANEARTLAATRLVGAITDYNTNQTRLLARLGELPELGGAGSAR